MRSLFYINMCFALYVGQVSEVMFLTVLPSLWKLGDTVDEIKSMLLDLK